MVLRRFVRSQCEILSEVAESASLKQGAASILMVFAVVAQSLGGVRA